MTGPLLALAESDCEQLRDGLLAQPANAVSSFAFVIAGVWLLLGIRSSARTVRPRVVTYACLGIAAGFGSVAFHGIQGEWAQLAHDLTLVAVALLILAMRIDDLYVQHRIWPVLLISMVALAAALMLWQPALGGPLQAVTLTIAVTGEVWFRRTHRQLDTVESTVGYRVAGGAIATAAVVYALSRTGSVWCQPTSLLQGHALWHVLGAVAFTAFAIAAFEIGVTYEDPRAPRDASARRT